MSAALSVSALSVSTLSVSTLPAAAQQAASPKAEQKPAPPQPAQSGAASGDEEWLVWEAPSGCRSSAQMKRLIVDAVGAPLPSDGSLLVSARVEEKNERWWIDLTVRLGEGAGSRTVDFENCEEAGNFVALIVALALDPDQSETDTAALIASAPLTAMAQPIAPGDEPDADPGADPAPQDEPPPPDETPDEDPSREQKPVEEEASETDTYKQPPPQKDRGEPWFAGIGLGLATAVLPQVAVGPTVRMGRLFGPWRVSLGAFYFPGGTYDDLGDAENPARLSFWGSTLRGCYLVRAGQISIGPCGAMQAGAIRGKEELNDPGREPHQGTAFYLGLLAGLAGELSLSENLGFFLLADLAVPIVPPQFQLVDGTEVFSSGVGAQGEIGIKFFF